VLQRNLAIQVEEAQMEAIGTARLTGGIPAQRAVAAYVPRQEITTVLQDPDAEPELVLRVRGNDDSPDTLRIDWSRSELEELLARISDDTVVLTFDHDELAYAFSDVEGHGLREKALVFAVAAVGALGAGGIANAMPSYDGGDSAVPITATAPDITTMTDASSGGYVTPVETSAADSLVTDASSTGGYAAASEGSAADTLMTDASSTGGYAAASEGSAADSIRTDVSSTGGYAPAPSDGTSGTFLGIHEPSTTDALLTGALLLTIAGATFASRRVEGPRPA
jgi:hypothetical protein